MHYLLSVKKKNKQGTYWKKKSKNKEFLQMHTLKVTTLFLLPLQNTGIQFHIKTKPIQWLADNRRGRTTLHLPSHVLVLALAFISLSGLPLSSWFFLSLDWFFYSNLPSPMWLNHKIRYVTLQLKQKIKMTESPLPRACNFFQVYMMLKTVLCHREVVKISRQATLPILE